jgi:hypothetical protein
MSEWHSSKYPLTLQERIDQWYVSPMHFALLNAKIIANYVIHHDPVTDSLEMWLYMKKPDTDTPLLDGPVIVVPIPDSVEPGFPWPALQVIIKLNQ